ncbi:GntR family transcriptional regulator [Streptomyces sp. NPDC002073]|uniref:GntR family transcriptional regulator n=1 Tax=Streptomyces sp. NBC_00239 TaxID=2903640 RepID=UPI002E2B37B7|nr:GntR family transcriptional regulator [Streptomyces sp. NBC_00239]
MAIKRRPLREEIRDELMERLTRGEFPAGSDVNEAVLAAELGVSRTPLREALITLAGEGVLESSQGRGFRFAPVSRKEFRELVAIVAALEALALESSDPAHLRTIAPQLLAMAQGFPDAVAEHAVVDRRDDEWHGLLLSGCPNERLLDLLTGVKAGMRRYENLVVAEDQPVARESEEHCEIARRLLDEDLAGAIEALRANWVGGMERMLAHIPAD